MRLNIQIKLTLHLQVDTLLRTLHHGHAVVDDGTTTVGFEVLAWIEFPIHPGVDGHCRHPAILIGTLRRRLRRREAILNFVGEAVPWRLRWGCTDEEENGRDDEQGGHEEGGGR